jgi:hypothetical protein
VLHCHLMGGEVPCQIGPQNTEAGDFVLCVFVCMSCRHRFHLMGASFTLWGHQFHLMGAPVSPFGGRISSYGVHPQVTMEITNHSGLTSEMKLSA